MEEVECQNDSLFYYINSLQFEYWTSKGLKNKIVNILFYFGFQIEQVTKKGYLRFKRVEGLELKV